MKTFTDIWTVYRSKTNLWLSTTRLLCV